MQCSSMMDQENGRPQTEDGRKKLVSFMHQIGTIQQKQKLMNNVSDTTQAKQE